MSRMRRPISELPSDHRRIRGVFEGVTDDGHPFQLEVREVNQRMNSGEMMRQHIRVMSRGMQPTHRDMYKDVTQITLHVPNRHRTDIEVLSSGAYRYGRHVERSLRSIVESLMEELKPRTGPRM